MTPFLSRSRRTLGTLTAALPLLAAAACSGSAEPAAAPAKSQPAASAEAADPLDRTRALPAGSPGQGARQIPAEFLDFEVRPDGSTVRVWVALPSEDTRSCRVEAAEKADTVELSVTLCLPKKQASPAAGASPTAYLDIPLKAPVGSRALLDSTGLLLPDLS